MIALSMVRSIFLVSLVLKNQLALEHEAPGGDDLVALAQAGLDHDAVAGLAADLDRARRMFVIAVPSWRERTRLLALDLDDGARPAP